MVYELEINSEMLSKSFIISLFSKHASEYGYPQNLP